MIAILDFAASDRRSTPIGLAVLLSLLVLAASKTHLLCGLVCLHGEAPMAMDDICRGKADTDR